MPSKPLTNKGKENRCLVSQEGQAVGKARDEERIYQPAEKKFPTDELLI
jgi:hypothetical protein